MIPLPAERGRVLFADQLYHVCRVPALSRAPRLRVTPTPPRSTLPARCCMCRASCWPPRAPAASSPSHNTPGEAAPAPSTAHSTARRRRPVRAAHHLRQTAERPPLRVPCMQAVPRLAGWRRLLPGTLRSGRRIAPCSVREVESLEFGTREQLQKRAQRGPAGWTERTLTLRLLSVSVRCGTLPGHLGGMLCYACSLVPGMLGPPPLVFTTRCVRDSPQDWIHKLTLFF